MIKGLKINKKQDDNTMLSCLLEKKDLEVVVQTIGVNDAAWLEPAKSINVIEFFYIIEGILEVIDGNTVERLKSGDSFYTNALTKNILVKAIEDSKVLYITNGNLYNNIQEFNEKLDTIVNQINQIDSYSYRHCYNVSIISEKLFMELRHKYVINFEKLILAARFFDVGKLYIPKEILQKSEKLTNTEYDVVKKHIIDGYNIICPLYGEEIAEIVLNHHEFLDGSGYKGLKNDEICFENRILSVADSFDAMISSRSYAKVYTIDEAIEELLSLDNKYDIEIVKALKKLTDEGVIKSIISSQKNA